MTNGHGGEVIQSETRRHLVGVLASCEHGGAVTMDVNEKTDPEHGPDRRSQKPSAPTRHHLHREGGYLGIDADVQLDYGDGTAEWLADRLCRLPGDPWQPRRSAWLAEGDPWASPHDGEPGIDPADGRGRDDTSRPPTGER